MNIKPIIDFNEKTIAFLEKNGGIFVQPNWLKIYDQSKIELNGIYNKGNDLIGAFSLYTDTKLGLKWIKTPPYASHIGLFFINPSSNNSKKITFNKKVYKLLSDYFEHKKYALLTLAFPPEHIDMQPFIWKNYKVIPNYTYQINLSKIKEEELLKIASPEKRNEQKKAIKDNVSVTITEDYSIIKKMVEHTFERKEKSFNTALVSEILNNYSNNQNSYSYFSKLDNEPISANYIIHDKNIAYYLMGGYHPQKKHLGAGVYALFKAIEEAKRRNISIFDFEGSMLPEVEKYFRGFGGEIIPYYTLNKSNFLFEVILKIFKRDRF